MNKIKKYDTESVFVVLTGSAKHNAGQMFQNELRHFLDSENSSYYFLSEDYYEHYLSRDVDGTITLRVESDDEVILERVKVTNAALRRLPTC